MDELTHWEKKEPGSSLRKKLQGLVSRLRGLHLGSYTVWTSHDRADVLEALDVTIKSIEDKPEPWLIWRQPRDAWYMPDKKGYSVTILGAGVYTKKEAKAECRGNPGNEAISLSEAVKRWVANKQTGTVADHLGMFKKEKV